VRIAHEHDPEFPVIIVSGTLGDEKAVEVLKLGATDYVLKDRLSRLVPAIERAVRDRQQRAEQRQMAEQLERARRMDSLGRVAGTIAHEVNNVLMSMQTAVDLLRSQSDRWTHERIADQMLASIKRGQRITNEVARFATPISPRPEVVDLAAWLKAFAEELRNFVGGAITTDVQVPAGEFFATADLRQIEQVVTNLAANARDAMPHGGRLAVRLGRTAQAGRDYADLAVADTGSGMPSEVLARVFEPLFTTKRTGTGLGLAVSYQMVAAQGGDMRVVSAVGAGTVFHVLLPAA
jgi:signal transduction histidine kinase